MLGYHLLTTMEVNSPIGRAWEHLTGSPLVFTVPAAILAASISALPFVVRTARAALEEVDPRLEAVARVAGHPEGRVAGHPEWRVAGHPEWRVAAMVTLPTARRGIIAGVALGFARALGDFGATVMVAGNSPGRTQTLPIAVFDAVQDGDQATARTGSLLLAGIAVVVLLVVSQAGALRR